MRESDFQRSVIKKLKQRYPGCYILKNDANYLQGVPDFIFLYDEFWAMLEFKKSEHATHRPNQDYYISDLNEMSFAAFIFPENEEEVLNDLEQAYQRCTRRRSRISRR